MKQDKFIELLNLYLDGALAPDAAAELEREITGDPARHKIYRQYCQIQRACTLLSERFRDDAAPAAIFRGGSVVRAAKARRSGWLQSSAWVASGAVAACFVFVAVQSQIAPRQPALAATPAVGAAVAVNNAGILAAGTTPVSAGRQVLFRDPWSHNPSAPMRMVGWSQLPSPDQSLTFVVPPLTQYGDAESATGENTTQPAGSPALRMEDVAAAAFQFQR
jgi:anti-sigma factor RsiW